MYLTRS